MKNRNGPGAQAGIDADGATQSCAGVYGTVANEAGSGWANGDYFDIKWVGEAMVFTGNVVGTLHAFVDSTSAYNNFCVYGTGWHVLLSGTLAFAH